MSTTTPTEARLDPELAVIAAMLPKLDLDDVAGARTLMAEMSAAGAARADQSWRGRVDVEARIVTPARPAGAPEVPLTVYRPRAAAGAVGALVHFHGGAFVLGDGQTSAPGRGRRADELGIVVVDVDYRLAPEHPYPAGVEDGYAALAWVAAHAEELGVDPARIAIGGASAGGGLAAGVALMARDRQGPAIALQLLLYPVLDDRCATKSAVGFTDAPLWNSANNRKMWPLYLGPAAGSPAAAYAAPARVEDLSGLPPAYVLACELDPLRDEDLEYGARLAAAGVPVELHQWPGTYHGYDGMPTEVSRQALASQDRALLRALGA